MVSSANPRAALIALIARIAIRSILLDQTNLSLGLDQVVVEHVRSGSKAVECLQGSGGTYI